MQKTTIYTLAKELNMTPSMISRALNPNGKISAEKRKIVLEAAERQNFSLNKFASRLSMRSISIGILINSKFEVNTEKMISGIKAAYAELKDYKITYDITVLNPNESTDEDIRAAIEKYKGYDGVILTGMSSAKYTPLINELHAENPNIAEVQAINPDAECLFASKHDECVASNLAAELLSDCLRKSESKNIILFTGDLQSALHSSAASAFAAACKSLNLNLLATVDMKDDEVILSGILPSVFAEHGTRVDGIYITSGISSPLFCYIEENGYDIPLVAFDTHDAVKEYMMRGIVTAAISQNVKKQMQLAFDTLAKHIINGDESEKTIYTDVELALKSNISQFD